MEQQRTAATLPTIGQAFHGGTYAGVTTDKVGALYALIKLDDQPSGALTWKDAMAWAKELGDGADLPNRVEAAMLFANLRSQLKKDWHWTNEEHESDASYAWLCHFYVGTQICDHESFEGGAAAVRRLPLQSFNPFNGPVVRSAVSVTALRASAQALLLACDAADAAIDTARVSA